MKKIFYLSLIVIITSATISSCTEEEIKPTTELNGGGNASDPKS